MSNDIIESIETRRSIRAYKPDAIPDEILDKIIEAGLYAASGMNRQDSIILVVKNKSLRDELSEMNRKIGGWKEGFDPFYGAPVVLVVFAPKSTPTAIYDGSLIIGNLLLAAHSLGISSCWIHRAKEEFETAEGKDFLKKAGIEGNYEGIGHCILGYAKEDEKNNKTERKADRVFYLK